MNEAQDYISKRRAIKPALYNSRRLKEKPRPVVNSRPIHIAPTTSSQSVRQPNTISSTAQIDSASTSVQSTRHVQQSNSGAHVDSTTTTATSNECAQSNLSISDAQNDTPNHSIQSPDRSYSVAQIGAASSSDQSIHQSNAMSSIAQIDAASVLDQSAWHAQQLNSAEGIDATATPHECAQLNQSISDVQNGIWNQSIQSPNQSYSDAEIDTAPSSSQNSAMARMHFVPVEPANQLMPLRNITNITSPTLPRVPPNIIAAGLQFLQSYAMNSLMQNNNMHNNSIQSIESGDINVSLLFYLTKGCDNIFTVNFTIFQEIKMEVPASDVEVDDDDDVELITPIDQIIAHKPTERKYDPLSGLIPFEVSVSQTK